MSDINLSQPALSVREVAKRYRVGRDRVRSWIRSGQLAAVNVADVLCGKPVFRVTREALAAFEAGRSASTPPKPPRRNRKSAGIDYFPNT